MRQLAREDKHDHETGRDACHEEAEGQPVLSFNQRHHANDIRDDQEE